MITLLILPVQILLVTFAMRGFSQGWNVELERRDPAARRGASPDAPPAAGLIARVRVPRDALGGPRAAVAER